MAIARGESAQDIITEILTHINLEDFQPQSRTHRSITHVIQASKAYEAGEHHRLYHGELIEYLPLGLRKWLVQQGKLSQERAQLG